MRVLAPPAVALGPSSSFPDQARTSSSFPNTAANCALRTSIFYTYVKINGQVCKLILDSGSCVNAVCDAMIHCLGLATHSHRVPTTCLGLTRHLYRFDSSARYPCELALMMIVSFVTSFRWKSKASYLGNHGYTTMTSRWQEEQILALPCIVAAGSCGSPTLRDLQLAAYHHLALDLWWFMDPSFSEVFETSSQTLQSASP